jgi:hypothetical protein
VSGLDWDRARQRDATRTTIERAPIVATARPVKSGKRYKTERHAENVCSYLNTYGKQRDRYEWFPKETHDGDAWEIWHRPRVGGS